jgi:hypothetical protein
LSARVANTRTIHTGLAAINSGAAPQQEQHQQNRNRHA